MITYSDNLYLTDKTRKKIDKIKQKIDTRSGMIGIVIIALSQNEKDVFELLSAHVFKGSISTRRDVHIIGVAENKEAAMSLVADMTEEYLSYIEGLNENDSRITMREYFIKKCR